MFSIVRLIFVQNKQEAAFSYSATFQIEKLVFSIVRLMCVQNKWEASF